MPLEILLVLVVGGISGIALALHMMGKSRVLHLNERSARAAWLRHFPESDVQSLTLSDNGKAALLQTSQGKALLWSFGADTVARPLGQFEVADKGHYLDLRFPDFAMPRARLALSAREKPFWLKELQGT